MSIEQESLKKHQEWKGKIEVVSRVPVENKHDLSLAYTPGVAQACLAIQKYPSLSYQYTRRWNTVAIITDGTAVLGLGDIGPEAAMPVMEGKAVLFKTFAGIDAIPLCLKTKDAGQIVEIIQALSGSFGAVNLEDISAPRCFEIERQLKAKCDIPIFHDDQHGTAIVVLAAIINSLKVVKKKISEIKVVINGSGAAGIAITRLLVSRGLESVILCDTKGAIYQGRENLNDEKINIAKISNKEKISGNLKTIIANADVFIGVSAPNLLTPEMVKSMAADPIIFAMANPTPEIMPDVAKEAGAKIVGSGRSDFPNQINNALAFPGVFRGVLDSRSSDINDEMKISAAESLATLVGDTELNENYILPSPLDSRVVPAIARAVVRAAKDSGVAKI